MKFYVWDETYPDEVGGAVVDAQTREEAIQIFHAETMGADYSRDGIEYDASAEKPEWWDKEEA